MPEVHPILVTGADGNIGGRVVPQLAAQGAPVRALVHHDGDRARDLRAMSGAQVASHSSPRGASNPGETR
jgi:uncharacterized protein YbjT (DUF2867 family)